MRVRQPCIKDAVLSTAEAMSENELRQHIEGCKNGNRLSQQWVFDRYYRLMFGVCLRYTNDTDRVQDMVQEGFLKVFSNIEGYTSKGSFEGWMRRIMVNTAIDAIRKLKADRMDATEDEHLEVLVGVEEEEEEVGANSRFKKFSMPWNNCLHRTERSSTCTSLTTTAIRKLPNNWAFLWGHQNRILPKPSEMCEPFCWVRTN